MQPILPFLALLVPLCSARSIRRTSPCPFHGDTGHPDEQLIEDEYVVMLHQGYSLDDHFAFIGQDFSKTAREFSPMPRLNAYTVKIDAVAIHDTVRYDPGVHSVSQNRRVKLKLPVDKPIVSTSANKLRHKRQDLSTSALGDWETEQRVMHYSIRMLNRWDFQDNGPPNWFGFYHVVSLLQ
jgi:hypothetical protein